jgi:hypothetical protein
VYGVPDAKYGEELCHASSCDQGRSRAPRRYASLSPARSRHYKVPRYGKFVDSFPMTVTGKVQNSAAATTDGSLNLSARCHSAPEQSNTPAGYDVPPRFFYARRAPTPR